MRGKMPADLPRNIYSANFDIPQVHHHPTVLPVAFGDGDDLIRHFVVISICTEIQATDNTLFKCRLVLKIPTLFRGGDYAGVRA
jgi:hypothetical protein